jgi:TPR repeat protein
MRHLVLIFLIISLLTSCVYVNVNESFLNGRQNFLNQKYEVARRQLLIPAEAGNPEAQYAIGYMYVNGLGTPIDVKRGLKWIRLSARSGYPSAQDALRVLEPQQIQEKSYEMQLILPASKQTKKLKTIKKYSEPSSIFQEPVSEEVITETSRTIPTSKLKTLPPPNAQ